MIIPDNTFINELHFTLTEKHTTDNVFFNLNLPSILFKSQKLKIIIKLYIFLPSLSDHTIFFSHSQDQQQQILPLLKFHGHQISPAVLALIQVPTLLNIKKKMKLLLWFSITVHKY